MIKTFEEYSQKLWKKVAMGQYLDLRRRKGDSSDYDKVFDLFDSRFDLVPYEGNENDIEFRSYIPNEYKYRYDKNGNKNELVLYFKKQKVDIHIISLNDEWYALEVGKYYNYYDENYDTVDYYVCDGFDGINQWLEDKFGKINESFNTEKNYFEIDLEEYRRFYSSDGNTKFEIIGEKELEQIKDILNKLGHDDVSVIEMYPTISSSMKNCINIYKNNINLKKRNKIDNRLINIDKLEDEWYLLIIEDGWSIHDMKDRAFKCDQVDGLLDCIKNIYLELNKRLNLDGE